MNLIKSTIIAFGLTFLFSNFAIAEDFDIDKFITKTNVILGADNRPFCSGTIISKVRRFVLTASHCVEEQFINEDKEVVDPKTGEVRTITVRRALDMQVWQNKYINYKVVSQNEYTAEVILQDKINDVAVIEILDTAWSPEAEAKFVKDEVLKRGQRVWVIGNPAGTLDDSLSQGIISAPQRTLEFGDGTTIRAIQLDASVIGGNSGGAVINEKGEMLGTLDATIKGSGFSFAVPISFAKELLRKNGYRDILKEPGYVAPFKNAIDTYSFTPNPVNPGPHGGPFSANGDVKIEKMDKKKNSWKLLFEAIFN